MSKQTEALKLALDVLTPDPEEAFWFVEKKKEKAIAAIREALAEQPAIKQDLTPEQPAQQEKQSDTTHIKGRT